MRDEPRIDNNTEVDGLTPVAVSGLTSGVTDISAGYYHSCAITSSGAANCWGDNEYGQLGTNTTTDSLTPVQVYGLIG